MNIGYARVSTLDQNLDLQLQALRKADCKKIFCERISGAILPVNTTHRGLERVRKTMAKRMAPEAAPTSAMVCEKRDQNDDRNRHTKKVKQN
jgi:DNA invertase Pin-like site-specific DNA recombinase